MGSPKEFRKELESLINRYSQENGSNTPDFILAKYMDSCLRVFETTIAAREKWYGHKDRISDLSSVPRRGARLRGRPARA